MRRLHIGLGSVRGLESGKEIIVFFAPPTAGTGSVAPGMAFFPQWRAKVKQVTDDALVVEVNGNLIGLSWDHIAGIQFAD